MIYLFFCLLFFIFYTFMGYPLLLQVLVKIKTLAGGRKTPIGKKQLSITVVMIVCNEEEFIVDKINNLLSLDYPTEKLNILIVDDASTDETVKLINSFNSDRITLLKSKERSGKAAGINHAMTHVNSTLVMMLDARQVINLTSATDLSSWFEGGSSAGAVSGELQFKSEGRNDVSEGMDGYWKYEKFIRKSESIIGSVPGVTGAIYMFKRSLYQPIPVDTILDDVLIPMNISKKGYWVGFDERAIALDLPSSDLAKEKMRKTRTIKGNYQLWLRNISFTVPFFHPIWWQYLSHKVSRLLAPYVALLSLVIGITLGTQGFLFGYGYALLFILGLMLYPLSLKLPQLLSIGILRLGISFIALNWFNMLGLFHYIFDKKQQAWKK
ncbi:MAG: glycosyltransferase [Oleispira sp.]|nr:glycosyltransferase [Oleispira sp.]MBL4880076.1 glycosyltransferase [Oleispira sp.]